jgi:CysZ protein
MIADIGRGTGYLAKGFSLIKSPGIRSYVLIPLVLNIVLFGGVIWYGYSQLTPLVQSVMSYVPEWLSFLESIIWLLITLMTTIIVFFTFTPIANVISAPFNAIMAEKIEEMLTGKDVNSGVSLMTIIVDSIKSQLGKLVYILLWSIGLFLVSMIPVINIISPVLWVVFGAWLLALEYMDYPMGNHDLTFQQQKDTMKKRRGLALGFGGSVMVLTSIPLLNFIVIPVAVAGATAMWVQQMGTGQDMTES